jgi:hypothetical protein
MTDTDDDEGLSYRFSPAVRIPGTVLALLLLGTITIGAIVGRSAEFTLFGGVATVSIGASLWRQLRGSPLLAVSPAWHLAGRLAFSAFLVAATWIVTQSPLAVVGSLGAVSFANIMWFVLRRRRAP